LTVHSLRAVLLVLVLPGFLSAQVSLVPADHPVYDWLGRQRAIGLAPDYSYEMLPLSRERITNALRQIGQRDDKLSAQDRELLHSYAAEFAADSIPVAQRNTLLQGFDSTFMASVKKKTRLLFSQTEPHVFAYMDSASRSNVVVDFHWSAGAVDADDPPDTISHKIAFAGGRVYGTIYDRVGFHLEGGNAYGGPGIRYHPYWGKTFETSVSRRSTTLLAQGFVSWRDRGFRVDVGNGTQRVGLGAREAVILRPESPSYNWLRLGFDSRYVQYGVMYGSLQGPRSEVFLPGGIKSAISPWRWLVLQRLQLRPFSRLQLSFTETVTYSNRGFDPAYLNPIYPLKLGEYETNDKDNPVWYFDGVFRPVSRVELYGTLGLDDLNELSDLLKPTGRRSINDTLTKLLVQTGATVAAPFGVDLQVEFLRVEPFFYTHRYPLNSYHINGFSLANDLGPNADQRMVALRQWLPRRSWIRASVASVRHGRNVVDSTGKVVRDVGGSIGSSFVDQRVLFLDGDVHRYRTVAIDAHAEPWRGIAFNLSYEKRDVGQGKQIADRRILRFDGSVSWYPLLFLLTAVGLAP
jgi:hypothetical protein